MRKTRKPGPWGQRIWDLAFARNWNITQAGKALGCGGSVVRRLLTRKTARKPPRTHVIVALRRLEVVYAEDLDALRNGEISYSLGMRFDMRSPVAGRPEDLAALDLKVGDSNEVGWTERG
jgi:hypothetical protein